MPYLICEKTKQKMRVSVEVCFVGRCPHVKWGSGGDPICNFESKDQKKIEKEKKK